MEMGWGLWALEEEQLLECCAMLNSIFLLDDVRER